MAAARKSTARRSTARKPAPDLPPLASVVVVNWNGGAMVDAAVESVLAQTCAERLRLIVVDNASTDGSAEALTAKYGSRLTLVRSERNLGFAAGNNLGFRHAQGDFLLLLNNDAVAEPTWAEELLAPTADPAVGMVASKILCLAAPSRLDNAGHRLYPDGLNRSRGHRQPDGPEYAAECETLFASGCAALYRRDAVELMGGFDEDFFAYGDDADLGLKLRLLGLTCRYAPRAVVRHRRSVSVGAFSLRKLYWIERNRVWVMLKYLPPDWILLSPWYTLRRLWAAWRAARRGQGAAGRLAGGYSPAVLAATLLAAWGAALWSAPGMWLKRRELRAKRKVTGREWRALLRQHQAGLEEMAFAE